MTVVRLVDVVVRLVEAVVRLVEAVVRLVEAVVRLVDAVVRLVDAVVRVVDAVVEVVDLLTYEERGSVVEAGTSVTVCLPAVSVWRVDTEGVVAAGCSLSAVVSRGAVVEAD